MWHVVGESVVGSSHLSGNGECQDAVTSRILNVNGEEVLLFALSDGAGSAKHAAEAARLSVDRFCSIVQERITPSLGELDLLSCCEVVRSELLQRAEDLQSAPREMSATLLAGVVSPTRGWFLQIGDGAIVRENSGEYQALTWPDSGEFVNTTVFLVSPNWREAAQQLCVAETFSTIAAFTDGLQELVLRRADRTVHQPFFPGNCVAPEILQEWKKQFRLWIVGCGFREVVDSLCAYLDQIYLASSIAVTRRHDPARQQLFERKGLDKKLATLREDLGITSPNASLVESFYPVRNCLVHRLGRVGPEDAKPEIPLTLRYRRMEFVHTAESGRTIALPDLMDPKTEPFLVDEAGSLGMLYRERTIEFPLGTIVSFTPKELTEILFFTNHFLPEFNQAVLNNAARAGAYTPAAAVVSDPQNVGAPQVPETGTK